MSDCRHNAPNRELNTGDVQTQRQQLDDRTREEMLDRLVDCLYNHDGDVDISAIDRCLEDLEQAGAACEDFDVEQGLMKFHERFDEAFENYPEPEVVKTSKKRRPLARIAIIAAAMCIFVVTAQASGWGIIGAIARWTSEQFSFVTADDCKDDAPETSEFSSLQEALNAWRITEKLSPTRFPDGTDLSKVMVKRDSSSVEFFASYTLSGETFYISLRRIFRTPCGKIEIENQNVESYEIGGIIHYIMTDVKQRKATWQNGEWECFIAGDLSRHDMVTMIDSIYR